MKGPPIFSGSCSAIFPPLLIPFLRGLRDEYRRPACPTPGRADPPRGPKEGRARAGAGLLQAVGAGLAAERPDPGRRLLEQQPLSGRAGRLLAALVAAGGHGAGHRDVERHRICHHLHRSFPLSGCQPAGQPRAGLGLGAGLAAGQPGVVDAPVLPGDGGSAAEPASGGGRRMAGQGPGGAPDPGDFDGCHLELWARPHGSQAVRGHSEDRGGPDRGLLHRGGDYPEPVSPGFALAVAVEGVHPQSAVAAHSLGAISPAASVRGRKPIVPTGATSSCRSRPTCWSAPRPRPWAST